MYWKTILIILLFSFSACERPEPEYVLKAEVGESAIPLWEDLAEDPKIIKVKKSDVEKQRDLEKRRTVRREKKGIYSKASPWDY